MRQSRLFLVCLCLAAAAGCGRSADVALKDRVAFVRGGVVVPAAWAAGGRLVLRSDNATVTLSGASPIAQGIFFPFAWTPGTQYELNGDSPLKNKAGTVPIWAPMRPEPAVVAVASLERVRAGSVTSGGEPDASLAFSDDGTLVAVGTFGGYLRVFDTETGRRVFEKHLSGAVVKRVAISADDSRVYAGEMSVDGFVRAFDLRTGKELWRFRLADELGASRPARADDFFALYSYPQAYCMRAFGADLLVDGFHSWKDDTGAPRHLSRLYRLSGATGRPRWRYPADAPLPRNIAWLAADSRVLAFSAYQWERPAAGDNLPQAFAGLVDLEDGRLLDRVAFEPLRPFFDTTPMWYGLALDGEGHLAVGMMDGRAGIFGTRMKEETIGPMGPVGPISGVEKASALTQIRLLELATPVDVTGVPVYAGAGWAAGEGGTLYILTDGRLVAPSASAKGKTVRADHYNSNTLFAFDGATGKLLWQWKLANTAQSVAAAPGIVAVSTQTSYSADDPLDYSVTVFDTEAERGGSEPRHASGIGRRGSDPPPIREEERGQSQTAGQSPSPVERMLFRYNTTGPIVALAVSPDGATIACVEAPVRLADGVTVVGDYRLHIIR